MQWYYKGGLICGLLWAAGRALGMAGEDQRQLDINFLFGFMLTVGGWSAVFLIVDMVLRATGLRKGAAGIDLAPSGGVTAAPDATPVDSPATARPTTPIADPDAQAPEPAANRPRRRSGR